MTANTPGSKVRELFDGALEIDAADRAAWLIRQTDDSVLRARVQALLDAQRTPSHLLDQPFAEKLSGILSTPAYDLSTHAITASSMIGQRIGAYVITRLIGQGGMASVFEAQRSDGSYSQSVAIKLLRRTLHTELELRLFQREQQALAALEHPNIARLLDGGITDSGAPYLVMERVHGTDLLRFVQGRNLPLRERLSLFVQICDAVNAAHRALIVHRDIKPANILVTDEGVVKLLDFGIAKILNEDAAAAPTTYAPMTPEYAAPEQFDGRTITTATDVYGLGVVLHEALTGSRPTRGDTRRASDAITAHATQMPPTTARNTGELKRFLRGDIDNVLRQALAIEPNLRYSSAGDLAADLRRFLDGQPVQAHPPSGWYRTRKFVGRNRLAVALCGALLLGLLASLSVALQQAREAMRQTAVALSAEADSRAELAHATSMRDFLEALFEPVRIGIAEGKAPTVRELVLAGETQLRENSQLGAEARVEMLSFFAFLHESIGELSSARRLATESVELAQRTLGSEDPRYAAALAMRGFTAVRMEDYLAAEADMRIALPLMEKTGQRGWALANAMQTMSSIENINGHAEKSLEYAKGDLAERIFAFGAGDRRVGVGYNNIADALEAMGQYRQSILAYESAYAIQLARLGPDSTETTLTLAGLASSYWRAGQWRRARGLFQQAMDRFDHVGGKAQLVQIYAVVKLCMLEHWLAHVAEAEQTCTKARTLTAASLGRNSASFGDIESAEFEGDLELGDLTKAHAAYLLANALYPPTVANRLRRGRLQSSYAEWLLRQGRWDEARKLLPEAISDISTRPHKIPLLLAQARLLFACDKSPGPECSMGLRGDYEATLAAVADLDHPQTLIAETLIAQIDLPVDSAKPMERLRAVIAKVETELGVTHPRMLAAREVLARFPGQAE